MERINVYKQRVNSLRDRTHQIIGKRDSLRESLFKCEDKEKQIVEAGIRVGKAKFLLELFVKGTETQVKEYIEHSMNYGILAGVPEFVESAIKKARGGENKLEEAEEDLEEDLEGFIEEYNEQHVDDFAPGDGKSFEYSQQWEEC